MDPASLTLLTAATLAGTAYLNARYSLSVDLEQLYQDKLFGRLLGEKFASLGDTCTVYNMLCQVEEGGKECLWFEGRRWTYAEVRNGEWILWLWGRCWV